jgi:outer membrane lipopolysaccharide assembly protein LptE/RlpB
MILKNNYIHLRCFAVVLLCLALTACKVYTFKDVTIDYSKIKTIRIGYIDNKASYVNPLLSPRVSEKLQQKVVQFTKLTRTNDADAHYQIDGFITGYLVTTSGVSNNQAATNRLTVTAHIIFKNTVENKTQEFDVSRDFDFPSSQSLTQAEGRLTDEMANNLSDEIFNKIFSNW